MNIKVNLKPFWKVVIVLFSGVGATFLGIWYVESHSKDSDSKQVVFVSETTTTPLENEQPKRKTTSNEVMDQEKYKIRKLQFTGNLYDMETKEPISNAVVRLDSISVLTDSMGYYRISIATNKDASYRINIYAQKNGYVEDKISVLFNANSHNNILLNKLK